MICTFATSSRLISALSCAGASLKPGCAASRFFARGKFEGARTRQRAGAHVKDRAQRAIAECKRIAQMSEEPGRITRRFLTPPVHDVHALLRSRMESLGMTVHVDAAGNLRGLWKPPERAGQAPGHRLAYRHCARCRRLRRRARRRPGAGMGDSCAGAQSSAAHRGHRIL